MYSQSTSLAQVLESPWTAFRRGLNLDQNGFMKESNADPRRVLEDTQVHLDFVRGRRPVISDLNRRALERICVLADEHRFDVFIANGPLFEGLYADVVFQQYFVRIQSAIANMAGRFDHVYYILNPPAIFSADVMQSADHVSYPGAVHYSTRIAREILSLSDHPENPGDLSE